MSDHRLHERVILITGATGGVGSAVARQCAAAGATVVLLARTIPRLERLYDEILAGGAPEPALYPLDLAGATEAHYGELAATLKRELGGLHGLIHCAAELGLPTPLEQITGERWQRLLHVNLTAPAILTRELLPLMIDSAPAHAVFMGDSAVAEGKAYWGAYGVAKLGLRAYVNTLADETEGRGFRPYYLVPGPIRSPLRLRAFPAEETGDLPTCEGVAESILALLIK